MDKNEIFERDVICTFNLINNDCYTYYELAHESKNPVLAMCVIPYQALTCVETQKYTKLQLLEDPYNEIFSDMRNSIKQFIEKYGKASRTFIDCDKEQDAIFAKLLTIDALASYNLYDNLGVYCDDKGNIIGNTQHLATIFNFDKTPGIDDREKSFNLGLKLGEAIGYILCLMHEMNFPKADISINKINTIYRFDLNTNTDDEFWNNKYEKPVRLYMLHLISFIGFVNHTLSRMLTVDNLWLFRIRYISCYYCMCGLKKLYPYFNGDDVQEVEALINEIPVLFNSRFRGCMMHYSFVNKGNFCIDERYYNMDIPFYGLVESCFNGISFEEYHKNLILFSNRVEKFLKRQFYVDNNRLIL